MSKHTPGPWKLFHEGETIEITKDGVPVIKWTGFDDCRRPLKEHAANARLIAAAPELLAALEDIHYFLKSRGYDTRIVDAAITKAKGKVS